MSGEIELDTLSRKALMKSLQIAIAELAPKHVAYQQFKNAPEWSNVQHILYFQCTLSQRATGAEKLKEFVNAQEKLKQKLKKVKNEAQENIKNTQINIDRYVASEINRLSNPKLKVEDLPEYQEVLDNSKNKEKFKETDYRTNKIIKVINTLISIGFVLGCFGGSLQIINVSFFEVVLCTIASFILNYSVNYTISFIIKNINTNKIKKEAIKRASFIREDQLHFYQHEVETAQFYFDNTVKKKIRYPLPISYRYNISRDEEIDKLEHAYNEAALYKNIFIHKQNRWINELKQYENIFDKMNEQFPPQVRNINSLLLINGILETQRANKWSEAVNLMINDQFNRRQLLALYDIKDNIANVNNSVNDLAIDVANQGLKIRHEVIDTITQSQQQSQTIALQNQALNSKALTHQIHKLDQIQSTVSTVAIMKLLNDN